MSTYASVMVALDLGKDAVPRIKLAAGLADRFGARVIGVAGRQPVVAMIAEAGFAAGALIEQNQQLAEAELRDLSTIFLDAVGSRDRVHVRTGREWPAAFLLQQACAADLIVIDRQGRHDHSDPRFAVDPGDIVLRAGRPVLITPPGIDHMAAQSVVIAWKDTRETRRAVWDALPVLRGAAQVVVVFIGDGASNASALEAQEHLGLHGVQAETDFHVRREVRVADDVIRAAERHGADLIVSGGYGHSRTREWIFGGVTRDLLDHTPVCCLMAH